MNIYNKSIITILCSLFFINSDAQLISPELLIYENDIYQKLNEFEPGILKKYPDDEIGNLVFAAPLIHYNKVTFYKLGINANHSFKYLGIFVNNDIKILPTKDFIEEFPLIIRVLKDNTDNDMSSIESLKAIEEVYNLYIYNSNPPWKSRNTIEKL